MKYVPYARQNINDSDIRAVSAALTSDFLTQGPRVKEFENALAAYIGVPYVVAVNNGTSALHLAYLACGLKAGDEVITTPNTFVATSNMLLAVGAKPIFCDIRPDTYNIDEKKISSLITKKTKAIVPVHFAGGPCEMNSIIKIAKKHNLKIIEDASHALGSRYRGKKIGSLSSSAICFSFHAIKPITTGEGGAVVTKNKNIYEKLLLLRSHGVAKNKDGVNVMQELGFNYRLTDMQCALGLSQLRRLDQFIAKRRKLVAQYKKGLSSVKEISLPKEPEHSVSGWHIFVILTENEKIKKELATFLSAAKIGINYHYPPVFSQPYYRKNGFYTDKAPYSLDYFSRCLTLPLHTNVTSREASHIINAIKSFYYSRK